MPVVVLPHTTHPPVHPPLTSLRSFAPPYAPRRGRTSSPSLWIPAPPVISVISANAGIQRGWETRVERCRRVIPSVARNLIT